MRLSIGRVPGKRCANIPHVLLWAPSDTFDSTDCSVVVLGVHLLGNPVVPVVCTLLEDARHILIPGQVVFHPRHGAGHHRDHRGGS